MADFEPTSTIYFFRRTSVDPQNQPYFSSQADKINWYMTNHSTKIFQQQSYQRYERYVRVNAKAAEMREYDMMAFQNDPNDRWIICRVIEVEFVNPNTSQITFEVDSMQTFIEDIEFKDCWIEREMQSNDWNGVRPSFNNLMPEGLEIGRTVETTLLNLGPTIGDQGWTLIALSAYDANAEPVYTVRNDKHFVYGLNQLDVGTPQQMNLILMRYEQKGRLDGIAGIWMVPNKFKTYSEFNYGISLPTKIQGYTPKNAKCYTGEFCQVSLSNRQGISIDLEPEYFFTNNYNGEVIMAGAFLAGGGGLTLYPSSYIPTAVDENARRDYGVSLPMGVQSCYIGNSFANWISQNKSALLVEGVRNTLAGGIGAGMAIGGLYTGNLGMAAAGVKETSGALYNSINTMTALSQRAANPAGVHGQVGTDALLMNTECYGFTVSFRTPPGGIVKSIDQFFDVYGYRVCRVKKPNVNTRPYWNYVKCAPAVVKGPFTSRDKDRIEATLNSGVTFWHVTKGAVIGDYSLDNRE